MEKGKALNMLTEIYLILKKKAFVGDDKMPHVWRNFAQVCFWPIPPHSLQILKVLQVPSMHSEL